MASPWRPDEAGSDHDPQTGLPTFSRLAFRLFAIYLRRCYLPRHFHAVRLSRRSLPPAAARPLVIYANHPGWWDPALFVLLAALHFPRRRHFGPMEATALERYPLFKRLGAFGIEPGAWRGAARFLRIGRSVLAEPDAVMWITAEGAFSDPRRRPVRLRPGLAHLVARTPGLTVQPLALEYPFWSESRPEALLRFGEPLATATEPSHDVAAWRALLERRLEETMDALAREAMARDASLFEPLLRGSAGIGGVYDLWRRSRAILAGRRFRPEHDKADR